MAAEIKIVELPPMPDQQSFRQRFPGPWSIEETPSGYKVSAKCGAAIAYVYCYVEPWQNSATTGTKKLTRAEGWRLPRPLPD